MANYELNLFANADELAARAASAWLDEVEAANRAGKPHCVALSGGRITQKFFAAAVEQGRVRKISFAHVHFFWADERCVPPTDADSNFKMADELLFQPLKISPAQIHRLRGELVPAEAVQLAKEEIYKVMPTILESFNLTIKLFPSKISFSSKNESAESNKCPALDLVLLGMGEDGHVASLFPNTGPEVLNCSAPFLAVENSPKPPPRRISLSYAAIAAARQVWVLASGAGKEKILQDSLAADGSTPLARVIQARRSSSPARIFTDLAGIPH
jgi:6-phosphogluconolactonase